MKSVINLFKKVPKKALLLALVIAVAASMVAVAGTFAVFETTVIGLGETPISDWNFDVRINNDDAVDSVVSGVKLSGDDETQIIDSVTYNLHNTRDDSTEIADYVIAPGTSGYMPIEVDGSDSSVAMVITVKAEFSYTNGFSFTDNLRRTLAITTESESYSYEDEESNAVNATYVGYITYSYYVSYEQVSHWADDDYIDIGFRWDWSEDDDTAYEDIPEYVYTRISVTGKQITNANQIKSADTIINFLYDSADIKSQLQFGSNVLNILNTNVATGLELADADIEGDLYLDINANGFTGASATNKLYGTLLQGTLSITTTQDVKFVLGTNRTQHGYLSEYIASGDYTTYIPDVSINAPNADAYISNDFTFTFVKTANNLIDILNASMDRMGESQAKTMYAALAYVINDSVATEALEDYNNGADVDTVATLETIISATYANCDVVWDSASNRFAFVTSDGNTVAQKASISTIDLSKKYKLFKTYSAMPATQTYSIYAVDSWTTADITDLTVGFDAGSNDEITSIAYNRASATTAQEVLIRTNTFGTQLTVNAPLDTVTHYGYAGLVNVIKVAASSYDECGVVGRITATAAEATGHISVEAGATVYQIEQLGGSSTSVSVHEDATVYDINHEKIESALVNETVKFTSSASTEVDEEVIGEAVGETITASACKHEVTEDIVDGHHMYEVCKSCGYTVIKVNVDKKTVTTAANENVIIPKASYETDQVTTGFTNGDVQINTDGDGNYVTPALEETPTVDQSSPVDATCTHTWEETDYNETKHKVACSKCGIQYYENHSSWTYTDNDDGGLTHTKRCAVCGGEYSESHTYVDDVCVCDRSGIVLVHNETELNNAIGVASTIKFANDIALTGTVTVPATKTASFDLNTYNLSFVNTSGTQVLGHYIPAIYNLGTIQKIGNGTITIDGTWYAALVNNGTIGTIGGTNGLTINTTTTSGHTVDVCAIANYGTIDSINEVNATVCGSGVAGSINHSSTCIYNNTGATITSIKNSTIAGSNTNNVGIENNGTITTIESSTISSYDESTISYNDGINNKGTIDLIKSSTVKCYVTGTNSGSATNNYAIYNQKTINKIESSSIYGHPGIANAFTNEDTIGSITGNYFYGAVGGSGSKYIDGGYYSVAPSFATRKTNYVAQACSVVHDDLTFTYEVVEDAEAYNLEAEELCCIKLIKNDSTYQMFPSFSDAISYVNSNPSTCSQATFVMTKDISETTIEFLMSTFVYTLKLDLNGHTLSSNASAQQFINLYCLYLTVIDSSEGKTGQIVAGHNTYWSVFVQGNARFILESGTITISNQCWSVLGFNGNGKFEVKGGTINTSSAVYSGLTYTYSGSPSCEISGGTINNNAPLNPRWSRSGTCTFTVTGGTFSSNMNPTSYVDTTNYDVTTVSGKYVVTPKA